MPWKEDSKTLGRSKIFVCDRVGPVLDPNIGGAPWPTGRPTAEITLSANERSTLERNDILERGN